MGETPDDYDRLVNARLRNLVANTALRMIELAVLFSAFQDMAWTGQLLKEGNVPPEELAGIPDAEELLAREEDMTTGEALVILREFLDMSAEGQARLERLLDLALDSE